MSVKNDVVGYVINQEVDDSARLRTEHLLCFHVDDDRGDDPLWNALQGSGWNAA